MRAGRNDIRKIVVILAGSRTGSSFLFRALKSRGEFLAPTGEDTPFLRLAQLGRFDGPSYSDEVKHAPSREILDLVGSGLIQDIGRSHGPDEAFDQTLLASDYLSRLSLQWPGLLSAAEHAKQEALLIRKFLSLPKGFCQWKSLYLDWLGSLRAEGFSLEPERFELDQRHPRSLPLIEEPPYVYPEPRQRPEEGLAQGLPLVLKTSTNIYRIPLLRALFPQASFRWILLHRNPASTLSALMDGWLSSGFHSHWVGPHVSLKIGGYSDMIPGGEGFWKFDMPPGWQDYVSRPLMEVAAFQWQSAYERINRFAPASGEAVYPVRYEDLLSPSSCDRLLEELVEFAGAPLRKSPTWQSSDPVVAVERPYAGKWKKRYAEIKDFFSSTRGQAMTDLADALNYPPGQMEAWP